MRLRHDAALRASEAVLATDVCVFPPCAQYEGLSQPASLRWALLRDADEPSDLSWGCQSMSVLCSTHWTPGVPPLTPLLSHGFYCKRPAPL